MATRDGGAALTATKITNPTAIEAAYRALKRDIISGVRAPGERLRIGMLTKIYGFSPSPMREALQRLHANGLAVAIERRGFQVAPLVAKDFLDINLARIEVESSALRLSLAAGGDEWEANLVASAYQLERADRRLAELKEPDYEDWEEKNAKFHRDLIAACPSLTLLRICRQLNEHVERYRRASVVRSTKSRDVASEHRDLAATALKRDTETAVRLLQRHYQLTAEIFVATANADARTVR